MAGFAELSGSVIESPQGLHSNARTFSAKGRLIICKAIGRPQTGQPTSLLGVKSSLIAYLCTRWRTRTLTWINPPSIAGAKPAPHFSRKAQHPGHSASTRQLGIELYSDHKPRRRAERSQLTCRNSRLPTILGPSLGLAASATSKIHPSDWHRG